MTYKCLAFLSLVRGYPRLELTRGNLWNMSGSAVFYVMVQAAGPDDGAMLGCMRAWMPIAKNDCEEGRMRSNGKLNFKAWKSARQPAGSISPKDGPTARGDGVDVGSNDFKRGLTGLLIPRLAH